MRGLIYGNWQTCITYAFAELGLADKLQDGAKNLEYLASQTVIEPKNLFRFLRCCAQLQFIHIDVATKEITLTEFGKYLQSNHPYSQRDAARLNGVFYRYEPWGKILDVLKSGSSDGFSDTYKNGSLDYLKDKPELLEVFQKAMTNLSVTENENIAKNYDFSIYKHIIDIGGGHGIFLRAILEANPSIRGTIFDLKETLASVKLPIEAITERITLQEGDFFQSVPTEGDIYTLKNILHNWPEEKVKHILKNVHLAISTSPDVEQKRVLVIEHLMSDDTSAESIVPWMDMNFFILVGGQDRTLQEYTELFTSCGYVIKSLVLTKTGRSIIELGVVS
jgi:O-methyltransferase domain